MAETPNRKPAVVVTDIEGTTSDVRFVHEVLFPYSFAAMPAYVRAHAEDPAVSPWLAMVAEEIRTTANDLPAITAALLSWIEADRKHTALKALQGQIWERGFREGAFTAHVYPDAAAALRRWRALGLPVYVYSSGSVHAQRLYFAHTSAGDLSDCLRGHFDTTSGAKREAESYRRIAAQIGAEPATVLFLSDSAAELDAAREAGWQTVQVLRPGTTPAPSHRQVATFDELGF
jgi:enolase-phosphatase E1